MYGSGVASRKDHKKRKATGPQLSVHGTASTVSHRSNDNRRQRTVHGVVLQNAGPSAGVNAEEFWADDLDTNEARMGDNFTYRLGDDSVRPMNDHELDDGTTLDDGISVVVTVDAVPRNANSDRPLKTWYPFEDEYLQENLRREGRGSRRVYSRCAGVPCKDPTQRCPNQCIVAAHARLPTHFIEQWDGKKFLRKRKGLRELGLRVQLGEHPPGVVDFVLYDLSGVHEVCVDFCGCLPKVEARVQLLRVGWWSATVLQPHTCATIQVLRLFHALNCLGKLSAYDFLRGLEITTNRNGLDKPPDRRKPFMHIVRQYREVKRKKRARRGHDEKGAKGTAQGELALKCRACPQPGWNMPANWKDVDPFYRCNSFIYFIFLAVDANFRLSNRAVSSEVADPILGDGFGYFCKREGEDGYKAHIGHCNMDYLIVSVLMALHLLWIIISYDIACQYMVHFWERITSFPASMQIKQTEGNVWWKVPNFHLPDHKPKCHSPYSFHWMWGAGMTHGEGVEQNWAFSNGAAASTRLMGPGSRQAALEDIFGFHNYDRVLAMHRVLPKRLAISIKEGMKHRTAFQAFNDGLEALKPEEVKKWRESVAVWEAKQHKDPSESPFEVVEDVKTLRDIQLEIASEEFICTDDGVQVELEHSPGSFLTMGLQLEEVQRRLEIDVRALKDPTAAQKLAFTKRRTTLLKQIIRFRKIQRVYMPAVRSILSDDQRQVFDGNGEQLPEATRLFMPSEIADAALRGRVCAIGLPEVERRMRRGEAGEALEAVRQGLRTRTMTNRFRLRNYTGQGMMTKGQGILRRVNIKISLAKVRYRYSRAALLALEGHGDWETVLRVLKDDDVRALNERALTAEEKAQNEHWAELGGAIIEGGIARASGLATGEGAHTLSWIWYTADPGAGGDDTDDPRFYDALRVEWIKAFSRTKRYTEDVRILREEMRRTMEFGRTEEAIWDKLAEEELPGSSAELTEGRQAYAAEHAERERQTCTLLEEKWGAILRRADHFLDGTLLVEADETIVVTMDLGDELEPDEEEARLEADEEGE
ncbi:hypothetical protein DFH06DRAFT_1153729 [Mycena polygramma]|nr:hypothetical protein DFH06DRAFT_1153729 [Mycena polygramma]